MSSKNSTSSCSDNGKNNSENKNGNRLNSPSEPNSPKNPPDGKLPLTPVGRRTYSFSAKKLPTKSKVDTPSTDIPTPGRSPSTISDNKDQSKELPAVSCSSSVDENGKVSSSPSKVTFDDGVGVFGLCF